METTKRTFAKAITWQISGLTSMSLMNFFVLGSVIDSVGLALGATALGFVCYFLHEKAWIKVRWGRSAL